MKITLGQVFALSLLGLMLLLALLFSLVLNGTQQSILQSSRRSQMEASREIAQRVRDYLGKAEKALAQVENQVQHEAIDPRNPIAIESALFSILLSDENISEVTLTQAEMTGYDASGDIQLAPMGRGQVSVFRGDRKSVV